MMRKTFTFLLVLVAAMMALQASAQMYIVGDGPFGGWNPAGGVILFLPQQRMRMKIL